MWPQQGLYRKTKNSTFWKDFLKEAPLRSRNPSSFCFHETPWWCSKNLTYSVSNTWLWVYNGSFIQKDKVQPAVLRMFSLTIRLGRLHLHVLTHSDTLLSLVWCSLEAFSTVCSLGHFRPNGCGDSAQNRVSLASS